MFYKILDSRVLIADEDSIVLFHDIFSQTLVDGVLKDLIDFDLIDDVIVFSEIDDQVDEEVDDEDEQKDGGEEYD